MSGLVRSTRSVAAGAFSVLSGSLSLGARIAAAIAGGLQPSPPRPEAGTEPGTWPGSGVGPVDVVPPPAPAVVPDPPEPPVLVPEPPETVEDAVAARWPTPVDVPVGDPAVTPDADPSGSDTAAPSAEIAALGQRNATEVIAALRELSFTELAELRTYEVAHRNRKTVLAAIDTAADPDEQVEAVEPVTGPDGEQPTTPT